MSDRQTKPILAAKQLPLGRRASSSCEKSEHLQKEVVGAKHCRCWNLGWLADFMLWMHWLQPGVSYFLRFFWRFTRLTDI